MCWNDKETQELRFDRLLGTIPPLVQVGKEFSIHEVGYGTAALHGYLLEREISHKYSGTDIVEEMLVAARGASQRGLARGPPRTSNIAYRASRP